MKHPLTVHPLTDGLYQKYVAQPAGRGHYSPSLAGFLSRHRGATHGVFDAEGRLAYIGKAADLRAAHEGRPIRRGRPVEIREK